MVKQMSEKIDKVDYENIDNVKDFYATKLTKRDYDILFNQRDNEFKQMINLTIYTLNKIFLNEIYGK